MTTYANIKLSEIFALYGNPFSRGSCKKNVKEKILKKYMKKINFEEIIKNNEIKKQKSNIEDNSQLNILNKNENGLMILRKNITFHNSNIKCFIKIDHLFSRNENNNKFNSKIYLNTDAFSVSSQKKRTQQELIRRTKANFTSEENQVNNTKFSSLFVNTKFKENINGIYHINNNK